MTHTPITISAYLKELVNNQPEEFPGSAPNPSDNAEIYQARITNLWHHCKPLYEEAAQSALQQDIQRITEQITTSAYDSPEDAKQHLESLRLQKLRYLTGHGPRHVHQVDAKAYEVMNASNVDLTPYETFILSAAIYIHDAGLIYGRDGHEHSIHEILKHLGESVGTKQERNTIEKIARAHGGVVPDEPENRATIDVLPTKEQVQGKEIRPQLIAALLRLSDELSEDFTRSSASRFNTAEERREHLGGSEVFHVYATCLQPCRITASDERAVNLQYLLNRDDAMMTFQKGDAAIYLLDEIYARTLKCFAEVIYCGRFIYEADTQGGVRPLNEVRVTIEISDSDEAVEPHLELRYTLKNRGYPNVENCTITQFAPELFEIMQSFANTHSIPESQSRVLLADGPTGKALANLLSLEVSNNG